jgi:hypothetical protein
VRHFAASVRGRQKWDAVFKRRSAVRAAHRGGRRRRPSASSTSVRVPDRVVRCRRLLAAHERMTALHAGLLISSPQSVALRPRVATRAPMSGASWPAKVGGRANLVASLAAGVSVRNLLTVRVVAAEVFPHLAPALPPSGARPPRCQRNRLQDTQNPAHRYSLLPRTSGVNYPTTRTGGSRTEEGWSANG